MRSRVLDPVHSRTPAVPRCVIAGKVGGEKGFDAASWVVGAARSSLTFALALARAYVDPRWSVIGSHYLGLADERLRKAVLEWFVGVVAER